MTSPVWELLDLAGAQNGEIVQVAPPYRIVPQLLFLSNRTITPDFIYSLKNIH